MPTKSLIVMDNAPYHSVQDPESKTPTSIEVVWGIVKGDVGRSNTTFKLRDVEQLVKESLGRVTVETWRRCVATVVDEIEPRYWSRDGLRPATVQPIIVAVGSGTSSSNDKIYGMSESDCD